MTLRLLADEDFRWAIVSGLRRAHPSLDPVCAKDIGLVATPDALILERAAQEGRVLLTHDCNTMIGFAYARVGRGEAMPGVFAVRQSLPIGQVHYLPLRAGGGGATCSATANVVAYGRMTIGE